LSALQSHSEIVFDGSNSSQTIGLISDTHIPVRAKKLPRKVFEVFQKTDVILHAGDIVNLEVIDQLERLAPVIAVYGNMDGPDIRGRLTKVRTIKVFKFTIGVIHNPGVFYSRNKLYTLAEENGFDVLVYGHTHTASVNWNRKGLFVNPGSPTNPEPVTQTPSVAVLEISEEIIAPKIMEL